MSAMSEDQYGCMKTPPQRTLYLQFSTLSPIRSEDEKGTTTSFTYLRRVDPTLVFEIETESKTILYVKYAREYGEAAHRKAHELS